MGQVRGQKKREEEENVQKYSFALKKAVWDTMLRESNASGGAVREGF